jgi:hypothetical protein
MLMVFSQNVIRVGYRDDRKETTTGQENNKRSETRDEGQRRRPDINESQVAGREKRKPKDSQASKGRWVLVARFIPTTGSGWR